MGNAQGGLARRLGQKGQAARTRPHAKRRGRSARSASATKAGLDQKPAKRAESLRERRSGARGLGPKTARPRKLDPRRCMHKQREVVGHHAPGARRCWASRNPSGRRRRPLHARTSGPTGTGGRSALGHARPATRSPGHVPFRAARPGLAAALARDGTAARRSRRYGSTARCPGMIAPGHRSSTRAPPRRHARHRHGQYGHPDGQSRQGTTDFDHEYASRRRDPATSGGFHPPFNPT